MKKYISLWFFTILITECFAQSAGFNLQKYWFYRERYSKFFVSVGTSSGQSLPFASRSSDETRKPNQVNSLEQVFPNCVILDDLPDYLGWYLGLLGTEYGLLKNNNQSTTNLNYELYCALYALNRLDVTGAKIGNSNLDGLCIREDFPSDFISLHPELNDATFNSNNENESWNIHKAENHNGYSNDFFHPNGDDIEKAKRYGKWNEMVMSMDHYCRILMGLALITKYLDSNLTYDGVAFQDGETSIKAEAQAIANRIINYMKDRSWLLMMPNTALAIQNIDALTQTENCINGANLWFFIPEPCRNCPIEPILPYNGGIPQFGVLAPRGCAPFLINHGFSKAGGAIRSDFDETSGAYFHYDDAGTIANQVFWEGLGVAEVVNNGSLAYHFMLAAIGNSWPATQKQIYEIDNRNNKWGFYHLLNAALWDKNLINEDNGDWALQRVNTAPCSGTDGGSYEWFARTSLEADTKNQAPPVDGNYPYDKHNGLDYMLLFNIYCLTHPNYVDYVRVLNDDLNLTGELPKVETFPFPPYAVVSGAESSGTLFTSAPAKYMTTGTITSNQVIENKNLSGTYTSYDLNLNSLITITISTSTNAVANVTYKSSTQIRLTTGFHAKAGVKFHAYTEPIHCNASGTGYEKLASGGKEPLGTEDIALASLDKGVMYNPSGQNAEQQNSNTINALNTSSTNTTQTKETRQNDYAFSIAPNPNSGIFEVKYNNTSGNYDDNVNVCITDVTGRVVWSSLTETNNGDENNFKWDVNLVKFSKGIYSVKLQDGSNIKTGKIVVQ